MSNHNICKNLLNLNIHSLFFSLTFKEAILKMQGNILMKKGKNIEIAKLIKVFLKIKI